MKYPVYEATYRAGRVVAIQVLENPMTFEEFMNKYEIKERQEIVIGYKILAQTVLDDEAVEIGDGVTHYIMNPSFGLYLADDDISLYRIREVVRQKLMRRRSVPLVIPA